MFSCRNDYILWWSMWTGVIWCTEYNKKESSRSRWLCKYHSCSLLSLLAWGILSTLCKGDCPYESSLWGGDCPLCVDEKIVLCVEITVLFMRKRLSSMWRRVSSLYRGDCPLCVDAEPIFYVWRRLSSVWKRLSSLLRRLSSFCEGHCVVWDSVRWSVSVYR